MLKKNAELWWTDTRETLIPDGSVIVWTLFKEAFLKEFYSKVARLKKQLKFTHLTQCGRSVDKYTQKFTRLKRFVPSLVDTDHKMVEKFFMGLDSKIR